MICIKLSNKVKKRNTTTKNKHKRLIVPKISHIKTLMILITATAFIFSAVSEEISFVKANVYEIGVDSRIPIMCSNPEEPELKIPCTPPNQCFGPTDKLVPCHLQTNVLIL